MNVDVSPFYILGPRIVLGVAIIAITAALTWIGSGSSRAYVRQSRSVAETYAGLPRKAKRKRRERYLADIDRLLDKAASARRLRWIALTVAAASLPALAATTALNAMGEPEGKRWAVAAAAALLIGGGVAWWRARADRRVAVAAAEDCALHDHHQSSEDGENTRG